jgi:hypothetical protein
MTAAPILAAAFLLAQAQAPIPDQFLEEMARDLAQMLPSKAPASPACGDYAQIAKALADGYHEAPAGMGLQQGGTVLQLFVSPSGSFSLVEIGVAGKACVVAGGRSWEALKPKVEGRAT